MTTRKITPKEFAEQFKVKEFKGQWDCYGTWNCADMYELADTPENARIAMWNKLVLIGWTYTERQVSLMILSATCYWARNDEEIQRIAKLYGKPTYA